MTRTQIVSLLQMIENLGLNYSIFIADEAHITEIVAKSLFRVKITIFGEISSFPKVCYDFCDKKENRVDEIVSRKK